MFGAHPFKVSFGGSFTPFEWLVLAGLAASSGLLFYTYAGYPLLMSVASRLASRRKEQDLKLGAPLRQLSIILCVHNEELRLAARLENLLSLDWPLPGEVIVVCDGCTDNSPAVARRMNAGRVRVVELPLKSGKPTAINTGVEMAEGDVLVFCDARQQFEQTALSHLVHALRGADAGAASGLLRIARATDGTSAGFDRYWSLETKLRKWESDWDSTIGCTGAIYALRREYFQPLPADTILDDVAIPMQVVMQGKRVRYCVEAVAWDPQPLSPRMEHRRKLRTLAGNFQMLFRHPEWLSPLRNRTWWQLISHKYLRIASPFILLAALFCTALLASHPLFLGVLLSQLGLMTAGWVTLRSPLLAARIPGCRLFGAFLSMQATILRGLFFYLRHRKNLLDIWGNGPAGLSEDERSSHL